MDIYANKLVGNHFPYRCYTSHLPKYISIDSYDVSFFVPTDHITKNISENETNELDDILYY